MNLRPRRLIVVLFIAAAAATLTPMTASGAPVDDKRSQAAQLQAAIDENGSKIDALSEQGNGARFRLEQATADAHDAQARIDAAQAQADQVTQLVRQRAVGMYKRGGAATPLDAIDVRNAEELGARSKYSAAAASHDNALVDHLKSAREALTTRKQEYDAQIDKANAERAQIEAARQDIEAANARQSQLLGQVKGEIATLVQQEEQRKQAEAVARARAMTAPRATPEVVPARSSAATVDGGSDSATALPSASGGAADLPSASGGAAAAIAFARAQIGKPYVYAAAGPDAYDCSGLTMRAWEAGGVSMPHYSGAQYDAFPHVPLDALQPGDLIFWGPGGSDHVALYEGGGMVVYAPQTGDVVKEAPIYGNPSGAARPG